MQRTRYRTTINVRADRFRIIESLATFYRITEQAFVKKALALFIKKGGLRRFAGRPLEYQPDSDEWELLHFTVTPAEYDAFENLKCCSRFSFSYIVAMAVDFFLEHQQEMNKIADSYPRTFFTKAFYTIDGIRMYLSYWGIPQEQLTIKLPPD